MPERGDRLSQNLTHKTLNPRDIIPENVALPEGLTVKLGLEQTDAPSYTRGVFRPDSTVFEDNPRHAEIQLRTDAPAQVYGHELGHAIYDQMSSGYRPSFTGGSFADKLKSLLGIGPNAIPGKSQWDDVMKPYMEGIPFPKPESSEFVNQWNGGVMGQEPITKYRSEGPEHMFADLFGQYVGQPELLKARHPEVYEFFKNLTKMEYSRRLR